MSSSWLDPEGFVPSGIPLGGWLSFAGVVWKGLPERFGNHVGRRPRVGLWLSSLFVPSRVGLRAGNTVGATVGFFASLQPKKNAYTKVELSKTAEFRPHVNTCRVQVG